MSVRKSDAFIADVERQFEWYILNANLEVAEQYLDTVQATVRLIELHPQIGPRGGFSHPRLRDWRFFLVFRPFKKHVLFYETIGNDVIMRRAMHGSQDLTKQLLES